MNDDFDIFVSYSSDVDISLFEVIEGYFTRLYQKVYLYKRDNVQLGVKIKDTIENLIMACNHILVMVTPKALDSEWINFEIECANRHDKHPIAVCHVEFPDKKLPTGLDDKLALKYIDREDLRLRLEAQPEDRWGYTAYIPAGGFGGGKLEFSAEVPKALCHIGDRPMLFHIIDSLAVPLIKKVVVINHDDYAPDYIDYLIRLEYPRNGVAARDGYGHAGFKGKVECKRTRQKYWPRALKELAPPRTFVVQLCDVILSFDKDARTMNQCDLSTHWQNAFNRHRKQHKESRDLFLGTLITCSTYRLSVGKVTVKQYEPFEIVDVEENPDDAELATMKSGTVVKMNTGVAILEPRILEFIKDEHRDESLLGGAVKRALDEKLDEKKAWKFIEYPWPHWSHVMHLIDWRTLDEKRRHITE